MLLELLESAKEEIKNDFTPKEQILIFEKLEYFATNYTELIKSKNVKKLAGGSVSRYKISSKIRAIFITFCALDSQSIVILSVTQRKESYLKSRLKQYEKRAIDYKKSL